jgi:hypothetical protein
MQAPPAHGPPSFVITFLVLGNLLVHLPLLVSTLVGASSTQSSALHLPLSSLH